MNPSQVAVETQLPTAATRRWRPRWALVVAALGGVFGLVVLTYGVLILVVNAGVDDDTGMGAMIAQAALLSAALILASLGWFLVRGGRIPFWGGTVLAALGLIYTGTTLLP